MGGNNDDIDDLWSAVNALRTSVSELTALVREVRAMLSERCDVRAHAMADMEARLRVVEHRLWWVSGGAAVVGMLTTWFAKHW